MAKSVFDDDVLSGVEHWPAIMHIVCPFATHSIRSLIHDFASFDRLATFPLVHFSIVLCWLGPSALRSRPTTVARSALRHATTASMAIHAAISLAPVPIQLCHRGTHAQPACLCATGNGVPSSQTLTSATALL